MSQSGHMEVYTNNSIIYILNEKLCNMSWKDISKCLLMLFDKAYELLFHKD